MIATYKTDVVVWSQEQARLLRAGRFSELDIEHIAEEIEDVGKSEQRELASRMSVLLAHLLKWQFQPGFRGNSWLITIRNQRRAIRAHIDDVPSLKARLDDPRWWEIVWGDAVTQALKETGQESFPESSPWTIDQVMDPDYLPES